MSASAEVRLAVRRAMLGACIEAMERIDDSGGEVGDLFRTHEVAYLAEVLPYAQQPGILRDLLELATWEDYGLFHEVDAFLQRLTAGAADRAVRDLALLIGELRVAGLEYPLGKARRLRRLVLESAAARARAGRAGAPEHIEEE